MAQQVHQAATPGQGLSMAQQVHQAGTSGKILHPGWDIRAGPSSRLGHQGRSFIQAGTSGQVLHPGWDIREDPSSRLGHQGRSFIQAGTSGKILLQGSGTDTPWSTIQGLGHSMVLHKGWNTPGSSSPGHPSWSRGSPG